MGPRASVLDQRRPVVSRVVSSPLQGPVWPGPLWGSEVVPCQTRGPLRCRRGGRPRGGCRAKASPTARAASPGASFGGGEGVGPGGALPW